MKRISTLLLFLAAATPLCAATLNTTVTGDTFIRKDNVNSNGDDDSGDRMIVGSNTTTNDFRGMLKFDVSAIVNDVNAIGGGNFANLIINSASLKVFEAQGKAATLNLIVNQYGFAFVPSNNSWNAPASGDTTPGGTIGAVLGSQTLSWSAANVDNDATIPLSNSLLRTFIAGHLANSIHFMLTTDTPPPSRFVSVSSDRAGSSTRDARLTVDYTVIPTVAGLANGDFETLTGSSVFPVGWTLTGAPSAVAPFLPEGGGAAAVNLAPSQGILQDFAPSAAGAMENFQTDFAFQIGSESQTHRIRMEGDNGQDLVTIGLVTTGGTDSIQVFDTDSFVPALSGLSIVPETPYYLRVIGRQFGLAGRKYTVGFSTDGITYTTSPDLFAFHDTSNEKFETVTFECGATGGSSLGIDNVGISVPPDDSFVTWMLGYIFEVGADTSMEGDADQDGIANALENIFGTAPDVFSTGVAIVSGSSDLIVFTHPLNPNPASDLDYDYQWSTDLAEWKSGGESNAGGTIVDFDPQVDGNEVTVYADVTGSATTLFTRIVTTAVP